MSMPTQPSCEPSSSDGSLAHPRPRIFVSAYSCIPERGSEPGTGWNHAVEAAKDSDTWVTCEGNASEPEINAYFKRHGQIASLHFEYLGHSFLERMRIRLPGAKYLAYYRWNRRAGRCLHDERGTICGRSWERKWPRCIAK